MKKVRLLSFILCLVLIFGNMVNASTVSETEIEKWRNIDEENIYHIFCCYPFIMLMQ